MTESEWDILAELVENVLRQVDDHLRTHPSLRVAHHARAAGQLVAALREETVREAERATRNGARASRTANNADDQHMQFVLEQLVAAGELPADATLDDARAWQAKRQATMAGIPPLADQLAAAKARDPRLGRG